MSTLDVSSHFSGPEPVSSLDLRKSFAVCRVSIREVYRGRFRLRGTCLRVAEL
jgi:hypothetical protein